MRLGVHLVDDERFVGLVISDIAGNWPRSMPPGTRHWPARLLAGVPLL